MRETKPSNMPNPFESYTGPAGVPTDCTTYDLPTTNGVDCGIEYEVHEGEICNIWLVPAELSAGSYAAKAIPTDHTYEGDLDAITSVAKLEVIGDRPLGEPREIALPKFRTIIKDRTFTLTADVVHMSAENIDFIRFLQTPGIYLAMWYADYDGNIYGGANGIVCWLANGGLIHGRGEGTQLIGQLQLQWRNEYDPPADALLSGTSAQMAGPAPQVATRGASRQEAEPQALHTNFAKQTLDQGKTGDSPQGDEDASLRKMTKADLLEKAKELKVKADRNTPKGDLVNLILAASTKDAEPTKGE